MRRPYELLPGGPHFRDLLIGQAVSSFGDWMGTIALMALVLQLSGSPTAVGGVLVLRLAPSAVATPIAAGIADRYDRRRIMLAMDLLRMVLIALIPFLQALWWVYLLAFLTEIGNLVFLPARDASVPDLVDAEELNDANGLVLLSSYGSIPLGAAAFAGLHLPYFTQGGFFAEHPFAIAFWVDALTYLVSFAMIWRIRELGPSSEEGDEGPSLIAGVKAAFTLPTVRALMPALVSVVFGIGALFSLGIVFVREVLGASSVEFGFLVAFFGIGAAAGVAYLHTQVNEPGIVLLRVGVAGMGIVLAAMSVISVLWVSYLGAACFGAFASIAFVSGMSFLQTNLSGRKRLLGFAAFHAILRLGMSLGAIGAGFAGERIGPIRLPLLHALKPSAQVLFFAGLLTVLGAVVMYKRVPTEHHVPSR